MRIIVFWLCFVLPVATSGCYGGAIDTEEEGEVEENLADPAPNAVLVHGFHSRADGRSQAWNCRSFWANQIRFIQASGFQGRVLTAGYYSGNVGCDLDADDLRFTKNGNVTLEQGSADNVLTHDTPLEHAAYRMAWLFASVHENGHAVRVIADSLGGNVVRWAMIQSSRGNPNYPTLRQMGVTQVIAFGAPYGGTTLASLGPWYQAQQVRPGSAFTRALFADTRVGSARWVSFTSVRTLVPEPGDGFISAESACMRGGPCFRYESPAYIHGSYALDGNAGTLRKGAYRTGNAEIGWGPLIDDIGAPALAARLLRQ